MPLFGSGLHMGWGETLDLDMEEVADLLEWAADEREREFKAAFKSKKRG